MLDTAESIIAGVRESPAGNGATPAPEKPVWEVISASNTRFTAQCLPLHQPPAFGQFVAIGPGPADPFTGVPPDGAVVALVCAARNESADPNRRPVAYGLAEEELRRQQPQIFELLATYFDCVIVAYAADGQIRRWLPPAPPRLHAHVRPCEPGEVCAVTERLDFLRTLLDSPSCQPPDELIAACLRHALACHNFDGDFLLRAGREISIQLSGDYERFLSIIRRMDTSGIGRQTAR